LIKLYRYISLTIPVRYTKSVKIATVTAIIDAQQ